LKSRYLLRGFCLLLTWCGGPSDNVILL
jgi:hypothetical protein